MSKNIRKYRSLGPVYGYQGLGEHTSDLDLTAFVGGEWGRCVQFTMRNDWCCLSEKQVEDLIKVLKARLAGRKGFQATEWGEGKVIEPKRVRHGR